METLGSLFHGQSVYEGRPKGELTLEKFAFILTNIFSGFQETKPCHRILPHYKTLKVAGIGIANVLILEGTYP